MKFFLWLKIVQFHWSKYMYKFFWYVIMCLHIHMSILVYLIYVYDIQYEHNAHTNVYCRLSGAKRTTYVWNIVLNNRSGKYSISKMTTPKSDWLCLHDGCVIASYHQGDDRYLWATWGMQCVANNLCALMYCKVVTPDIWLIHHLGGDMLYQKNWKIWMILASDTPICMYMYNS